MAKIAESDFYYGAVLSTLFNKGICPMLIEGGKDRQVYEFTTDDTEFKLFLKYRSFPGATKKDDYQSWQFVFSEADIAELRKYIAEEKHLCVGLICGAKQLRESEYAVVHKEELAALLDAGKTSVTVSRMKGEKAFRISVGGGRENAMQIKSSRLY